MAGSPLARINFILNNHTAWQDWKFWPQFRYHYYMEKAILLFNGIKLPFTLIDRALSWAKQSQGEISAIFLRSEKDPDEGYIFPSDLDAAEDLSSGDEATSSHKQIIDSNVQIVANQGKRDNIEIRTIILIDPTENELHEMLTGCNLIFAHESITKPGTLTASSINLEKWLKNSKVPVEMVQG